MYKHINKIVQTYKQEERFDSYGLKALSGGSKIRLVHPLTKEQISKDNGSGKNWGGKGTIEQINNDGIVLQILYNGSD